MKCVLANVERTLQELDTKWASPDQTNMDSTYEATLEGKHCHCVSRSTEQKISQVENFQGV